MLELCKLRNEMTWNSARNCKLFLIKSWKILLLWKCVNFKIGLKTNSRWILYNGNRIQTEMTSLSECRVSAWMAYYFTVLSIQVNINSERTRFGVLWLTPPIFVNLRIILKVNPNFIILAGFELLSLIMW